jgi:hypothetical protein
VKYTGPESSKLQEKTIKLASGESNVIEVYAGEKVYVTETNAGGYETTAAVVAGEETSELAVTGEKADAVKTLDTVSIEENNKEIIVTNVKDDVIPDTGISDSDNTQTYVLVGLLISAAAAALVITKKKIYKRS